MYGLATLSSEGAGSASVSLTVRSQLATAWKGPVPLGGPGRESAPPPGHDPLIRFSQYSVRSAPPSKHGNKAAALGPRLLTPGSRPLFTLNGAARRLARG